MTVHSLKLKPHCGCKTNSLEVKLEKVSQGAATDELKSKVLSIKGRAKKVPEISEEVKSDLLNHLMDKLRS
jgi:hypothetical protein